MARGVNKVILIGNLGNDPEVKATAGGNPVTNIRIATTESWRDKSTGEQKEHTEWHRIVFFGRLAEIVRDYLKKGRQVYIEGRLRTRKWQDNDGKDRYMTEIVADEMQMLGSGPGGASAMESTEPGGVYEAPAGRASGSGAAKSKAGADEDFDDEIPF